MLCPEAASEPSALTKLREQCLAVEIGLEVPDEAQSIGCEWKQVARPDTAPALPLSLWRDIEYQ